MSAAQKNELTLSLSKLSFNIKKLWFDLHHRARACLALKNLCASPPKSHCCFVLVCLFLSFLLLRPAADFSCQTGSLILSDSLEKVWENRLQTV